MNDFRRRIGSLLYVEAATPFGSSTGTGSQRRFWEIAPYTGRIYIWAEFSSRMDGEGQDDEVWRNKKFFSLMMKMMADGGLALADPLTFGLMDV